MTQELQSQQEELRQTNDRLENQAASLRPETYAENLATMTLQDFREGMAMFHRDKCVVTVGVGR